MVYGHGIYVLLNTIIKNNLALPVYNYFEHNWRRFLNDCLMSLRLNLIKQTSKKTNKMLDILNNINSAIKFTGEKRYPAPISFR